MNSDFDHRSLLNLITAAAAAGYALGITTGKVIESASKPKTTASGRNQPKRRNSNNRQLPAKKMKKRRKKRRQQRRPWGVIETPRRKSHCRCEEKPKKSRNLEDYLDLYPDLG